MEMRALFLACVSAVSALRAVLLIHGSNELSGVALKDFVTLQKQYNVRDHFVFVTMDADVNDTSQLPLRFRFGPWPRLVLIKTIENGVIEYDELIWEIRIDSMVPFLEFYAPVEKKSLRG